MFISGLVRVVAAYLWNFYVNDAVPPTTFSVDEKFSEPDIFVNLAPFVHLERYYSQ